MGAIGELNLEKGGAARWEISLRNNNTNIAVNGRLKTQRGSEEIKNMAPSGRRN